MTAILLAALRSGCRQNLGDFDPLAYAFSDEQLDLWINQAIADYSLHFPRKKTVAINMVPDTFYYDLPSDFHGVLTVQYTRFGTSIPADPPEYFTHRSHKHPKFWQEDGYYDIWKRQEEGEPSLLIISRNPASAADLIAFDYHGDHEALSADTDACSVPIRHLHLVPQYVRWAVLQQLAMKASLNPDPTNPLMDRLEQNAVRSLQTYQELLEKAAARESETGVSEWRMDKWERTY